MAVRRDGGPRDRLDPEKALSDGVYHIEGDALLFVKFGDWFGDGR